MTRVQHLSGSPRDVREVGADGHAHYREAGDDLAGLRLDIRACEFAGGRVDSGGATDRDEGATRAMWL